VYTTALRPEDFKTTRRTVLKSALAAGTFGVLTARAQATPLALALARLFARTTFADFPPVAIKHAKMILASTLASAAPGTLIGSARIIRDLAKEQGGQPEATIW
jgi:hypothetical protein